MHPLNMNEKFTLPESNTLRAAPMMNGTRDMPT